MGTDTPRWHTRDDRTLRSIVVSFSRNIGHRSLAVRVSAGAKSVTAQRLHEIGRWRGLTGRVRRGSAAAKILALLPGALIRHSDDAVALIDAPRSSVFDAIGRLRDAGALRALTDRRRNQILGCRSCSRRIGGSRGADRYGGASLDHVVETPVLGSPQNLPLVARPQRIDHSERSCRQFIANPALRVSVWDERAKEIGSV